jgi:hypothetical protein
MPTTKQTDATATLAWWHWKRAARALAGWVRLIAGSDHGHRLEFRAGEGRSYVNWHERLLVVDPTSADRWGGDSLLPCRWRAWKVLTRQHLDWHVSRALARHEALHLRCTESWNVRGSTHAWLTNSLEDGRIERVGRRVGRYIWHDLVALGRLVWQQFTLPTDPKERLLAACLLHRWDGDGVRPPKHAAKVAFDDDDTARQWDEEIRPLVEQAWTVATCAEVAEIASEILRRIGLPDHDPPLLERLPSLDHGPGDPRGLRIERPADLPPVEPPLMGDDDARDDTSDDPGEPDTGLESSAPPEVDSDPSNGNRLMQPYDTLEQAVMGDARRLARRLQPPAPDVDVRTSATTGRFHVRAYVRSKGETPLVQRREQGIDPAKGLAICLIVDETGSMGGRPDRGTFDEHGVARPYSSFDRGVMVNVRTAVMLLDRTCALLGVPLCIGLAARGHFLMHHVVLGTGEHPEPRQDESVTWLREWHTPPDAEGPRSLIAGMYGCAGKEALTESLLIAERSLLTRREPTRIILYIHDGAPQDEAACDVTPTVRRLRHSGLHVVGIFLGDDAPGIAGVRTIFGESEHEAVIVPNVADLSDRLAVLLRRYYTRG